MRRPRDVTCHGRELGFSHISARPRHPGQDGEVVEAYKHLSAHAERAPDRPAQRKADRDLVPGRSQDRSEERYCPATGKAWNTTASAGRPTLQERYLFGAICLARGIGAGLALPFADTEAMQLHVDEISHHVERRARNPAPHASRDQRGLRGHFLCCEVKRSRTPSGPTRLRRIWNYCPSGSYLYAPRQFQHSIFCR